ncbi:MAG: uroporphyrinogen decarboxylase family protein [Planctomycetota bacterium]|nr:uroporphyrinogen decarboxylase family protein [Planctomycetota bacterium]
MSKDEMTPLERLRTIKSGGEPDRIRCFPVIGNTAARVIGVRVSELRSDGEMLSRANIAAYRRFGYDTVRIFTDLFVQPEAMGSKVRVPLDETAHLEAPAITRPEDVAKLKPHDPHRDGVLPFLLDAVKRTLDELGHEVPVTCAIEGPFTLASLVVGVDYLLRWILRRPDMAHRVLETTCESSCRLAEALLDIGVVPSITDAMNSTDVISPRHSREFSMPYLKRVIGTITGRGKGGVTLHICGQTSAIWEDMVDAGSSCISIDSMADLAEAKAKVGTRVCLMGNVPPAEVFLQGTPADVRRSSRVCAAKAWDNPAGFVLASGCSLPTETPFANIDAMMDAAREIGWPTDGFPYDATDKEPEAVA